MSLKPSQCGLMRKVTSFYDPLLCAAPTMDISFQPSITGVVIVSPAGFLAPH